MAAGKFFDEAQDSLPAATIYGAVATSHGPRAMWRWESIEEIISSGGIDPREWVSEWVEEALSLVVGVVSQRYVARRMGVGEGGAAKGKLRADLGQQALVESGGGEAARAMGGM